MNKLGTMCLAAAALVAPMSAGAESQRRLTDQEMDTLTACPTPLEQGVACPAAQIQPSDLVAENARRLEHTLGFRLRNDVTR